LPHYITLLNQLFCEKYFKGNYYVQSIQAIRYLCGIVSGVEPSGSALIFLTLTHFIAKKRGITISAPRRY